VLRRATRSGVRAIEAKAGGVLPPEMAAMVVPGDELEVEVLPLAAGGFDFQANAGELKVTVDERDKMDRTDGRTPVLLVLAAVGTRLIAAITVPRGCRTRALSARHPAQPAVRGRHLARPRQRPGAPAGAVSHRARVPSSSPNRSNGSDPHRRRDAQVLKRYSQMKLQMKREALQKLNRSANEGGILRQSGELWDSSATVGGPNRSGQWRCLPKTQ